jgi:hypothetical protein
VEPPDGEFSVDDLLDEEPPDGELFTGSLPDLELPVGELLDGERCGGELLDAEPPVGEPPDGDELLDAERSIGEFPVGELLDDERSTGKTPDGELLGRIYGIRSTSQNATNTSVASFLSFKTPVKSATNLSPSSSDSLPDIVYWLFTLLRSAFVRVCRR